LPVLPAFALLVAHTLSHMDRQPVRRRPWLLALVLAVLGLAGMLAPAWLDQATWLNSVNPGWGFTLLLVAFALWWLPPQPPSRYPLLLASLSVLVVGIGQAGVLHTGAPSYDARHASRLLARAQDDGQPIASVARYHGEFTFHGRLRQPVEQLGPGEADDWAAHNPEGYLILTGRGLPAHYPHAIYNRPWRSGRLIIVRGDVLIPYNGAPDNRPH